MTGRLVAVVIVLGFTGYWMIRFRVWLAKLMVPVYAGRFLTGEAHHGRPVTDAGWFRHGTTALTPTGHAHRWWHRPKWQRTLHRSGTVLAFAVLAFGWWVAPQIVTIALIVTFSLSVAWAAWRLMRWHGGRNDRRTWQIPAHKALHEIANWPHAKRAGSWITVTTEATAIGGDKGTSVVSARLELPSGWPADAKDRERLAANAATIFGIEAPDTSGSKWAGPEPILMLARSEPPPSLVKWEQVADAVEAAHSNELICGIGKKDQVTKASLSLDSPHFGINAGSGGGKSNLTAFWLMQQLHRGAIAMVLDAKWFSHPWLIKDDDGEYAQLPNVSYLSSPAELHAGMVWLGKEINHRARVGQRSVTAGNQIKADLGPRLIVVAEELNLAMPQLREFWQEIREPGDVKKSPALTGFGSVSFAGRALKIHVVLVGQMVTADVTGSKDSSVKQSVGVWAMARYGSAGWKTAVGDVPMPPVPDVVGRIQLVVGRKVHETQPPLIDMSFARQFAVSGQVSLCPAGMPGAVTGNRSLALPSGPDLLGVPVTGPVPAAAGGLPVTLKEAVERRVVHPRTTHGALKMARFREKETFPKPTGQRGTSQVYDAADLAAWDQARRS